MNILIIGGFGNIGKPVSLALAQAGHQIMVVGRRAQAELIPGISYVSGDTSDAHFLYQLQHANLFDVVINFAIQTPQQAQANIEAFGDSIRQFIFISTVTVLDRQNQVVLNEQSAYGNPYSSYAQRKTECELLFLQAYREHDFPVTIVRPSQTYSGDKFPLSVKGKSYWSVFERILNNKPVIVHGDGTSTWVSMHSDDFARFFVPLVGNNVSKGEIYHITGDEVLTWNMIYQEIGRQLDRPVNMVHITTDQLVKSQKYDFRMSIQGDKQYSVFFDLQKIRNIAPGIQCEIPLSQGLARYLAFMEQHPALKVADPDFDKWCDDVINRGVMA